jgi:hypothetical protein
MFARIVLPLAIAAALCALPGRAEAQSRDRCAEEQAQAADGDGSPNYRVVERNGRRVFVIEQAFVICGRVPRPNVIYVLQASAINYQWESLKKDFLPKIRGAVREEPF